VWATDAAAETRSRPQRRRRQAGHVVRKFSPRQLLMTLAEPGRRWQRRGHFRSPAGVVTRANGDIFIADGHGSNNRIVKYSKDGKFHQGLGQDPAMRRASSGGALHQHGQARPAVRVRSPPMRASRSSTRTASSSPRWYQFGMPSGIAFSINDEDMIYVFDSESDNVDNPGFEQGIRSAMRRTAGEAFHPRPGWQSGDTTGSGPEFARSTSTANVFAASHGRGVLRKYVKVR